MRFVSLLCFALFLLSATASFSSDDTNQQQTSTTQPVKKLSCTGGPTGGNNLTDDQIASLVTETTDAKTGTKLQFSAGFGVRKVPDTEKRKYVKSGRVPFRITCALYEIRDVNGKPVMKRLSGKAHLNIMDSAGKVIKKESVSLDKMCPS
jgi:hypothetical protein